MGKGCARRIAVAAVVAVIAVAGGTAVLMVLENQILFHPSARIEATPDAAGMPFEPLRIRTEDGESLAGWLIPHRAPVATILFLHGNAGNLGHRLITFRELHDAGFSILAIDYRGYGESTGAPSEEGLYRDARAAWKALTEERGVDPGEVIVYGESIGSAPALNLMAETERSGDRAPLGVVVEGALTSAREMARRILPFLVSDRLAGWFVRARLDNLSAVAEIRAPVLVIHGTRDEVVPYRMGERLYQAATSPGRAFHPVPGGRHNSLWVEAGPALAARVRAFAKRAHQDSLRTS